MASFFSSDETATGAAPVLRLASGAKHASGEIVFVKVDSHGQGA